MKYKSSTCKSKWQKTKWLMNEGRLRKYVPETKLFNKNSLKAMLVKYSTVYFKPTGGSGGARIIRIRKQPKGYQTQYNTNRAYYSSQDRLYNNLSRFSNKRSFLLQKGIQLARTNGRPFDTRVMVQKTEKGKWVSTAIFTKIGKPKKVATNYNQGGKIGYFHPTMTEAGYPKSSISKKEASLRWLGVQVGKNFDRHMRGLRELGLDVALDPNGKPWILEVNTRPQFYPLKNMSNKKMYRRILSYARKYGRSK